MATATEVVIFLDDFKVKMRIWGVLYLDNRSKNIQTLLDLNLQPFERTEILEELSVQDYAQGPLKDSYFNGANMWVFGKWIKGQEVYIKITLGMFNAQTVCISFHIAERPLTYPFKK